MSETRICPNCRSTVPADAPAGVCPACALRAGFASTLGPGADQRTWTAPAGSPSGRRTPPMLADELARRLPELDRIELLGQGGMGAVYRARHRQLDRPVAVKVLDAALRDDPSFAERFTREARTLAKLDHPNLVRVYDFGQRDELTYLIMELVDGVNLRQALEAGELGPEQALALVPRICEALQYAHDQGVVHRDIKPENILIDRQGRIKIADFGLAKLVHGHEGERLTRSVQVMGTPHYMAPEQIERPGEVDHRADIYSLGVVFYEMLTGELPVGRFPAPSKKVRVDVRLDEVVLHTLEKEPALRYQQASELKTDVESVSGGRNAGGRHFPRQGLPRPGVGPAATLGSASDLPAAGEPRPYEYRSERTVFGLPLVHIAFSRDPEGMRMRVASGLVAIGDIAIGGVAIGGFAFGGITFGGIGVGLFSFAGLALGLLTAMGGFAVGGFAIAGFALGLVTQGVEGIARFPLEGDALARVVLAGWLVTTLAATTGIGAAIFAWIQALRGRP